VAADDAEAAADDAALAACELDAAGAG